MVSCSNCSGVKVTSSDSFGASSTSCSKLRTAKLPAFTLTISPFSLPFTASRVPFLSCVVTVSSARSSAGEVEFGNDRGITQSDWAGDGEIDLAPQAHVLVGRGGIPIDEGDGEIVFGGGKDLHGEDIFRAGLDRIGDLEFVGAPSPCDVVGVSDLLAVEPDVSAVIDPFEIQPHGFSLGGIRRGELIAVPPGNGVRAVALH